MQLYKSVSYTVLRVESHCPVTEHFDVDNEYRQSPIENAEYFVQLEKSFIDNGVVVPL